MLFGFIRALPFTIGVVALLLSWFSWGFGSPPTYSIFSSRVPVVVSTSRVEQVRVTSSRRRYAAIVDVIRDGGAGQPERLQGLMPAFASGAKSAAEAAVKQYPQGAIVKARRTGGTLYADRTELFNMVHAVFLSLLGIVFFIPGALLLLPGPVTRRIFRRKGR